MELFLGAIALTIFTTTVAAVEEHLRWMDSYKKAGEEDRQYQIDKHSNEVIEYHE